MSGAGQSAVLFYVESDAYGEFSSWWPAEIELDGKRWPTTEHYFMAQKTEAIGPSRELRGKGRDR